jgi:hypothetical protein
VVGKHRWHGVLVGKSNDLLELGIEQRIDVNHQGIDGALPDTGKRLVDLAVATGVDGRS